MEKTTRILDALKNRTTLSHRMKSVEDAVQTIHSDIKDMKGEMGCLKGIFLRQTFVSGTSPLTLTERGSQILEESGGGAYVLNNKDRLITEFSDVNGMFDIQQKAFDVIKKEAEKKDFHTIKNYMFSEGITLDDIAKVMGIALRDEIFAYKGIPVKDRQEK